MAAGLGFTANPAKFVLRRYRRGDLDAMYVLDALCFQAPFRFSRNAMRRFAERRGALVTIAEPAERPLDAALLAGFSIVHIECGPAGPAGYLVTLDVAAEWRRQGLARLLLATAEHETAHAGAHAMRLHVSTGNVAAQALYESMGYGLLGVAPGFYGSGGDARVYRKRL